MKQKRISQPHLHFISGNSWDRQFDFDIAGTVYILAILEAQKLYF